MRIVYLGNGERGVGCLQAVLAAGHDVAGVVAHPDSPVREAIASVKETALAAGIPVIQPVKISEDVGTIRKWRPELLVLAGYTQIIRRKLFAIPRYGAINLHGGRLPEYRGASVLNWMIINGESEGGVSIIQVDAGIDTGDILAQTRFPIGPDDTIRDVQTQSLAIFPEMLVDVIARMEAGTLERIPQDPLAGCTYAKRRPRDGILHWSRLTAVEVHNRVRALTRPLPGAFTHLDGRKLLIWKSRRLRESAFGPPGRVIRRTRDECVVACKDRAVAVSEMTTQDGEPIRPPVGCDLS